MSIHLTTHGAFSLQEGVSTPTDLVQAAHANGMPALGLTDHNLLTRVIEFVTACKGIDIQPIVGLEKILTGHRMQDRFQQYPQAIAATSEIAERCKFDLSIGSSQMPKVPLPDGVTVAQRKGSIP